jgi:transposase
MQQWGSLKILSPAVKQVIVDSYRQMENYSETARILNMDRKTVYAVVKRYEMRGNVENAKKNRGALEKWILETSVNLYDL